mgnify:CR=1 FL=1
MNHKHSNLKKGDQLGSEFSLAAVMFHQAVAEKSGLNVTDYKCLSTLLHSNALTPSQLAQITGLSTAAMTTVIDRLEKAGFVRRSPDPKDRRRVFITAHHEKIEQEIVPHLQSFFRALGELFSQYKPEEINLIADFIVNMTELFQVETKKLRNKK